MTPDDPPIGLVEMNRSRSDGFSPWAENPPRDLSVLRTAAEDRGRPASRSAFSGRRSHVTEAEASPGGHKQSIAPATVDFVFEVED